jgi:glucosamine-phosphate N-acetyltransferase
MQPSLLFGSGLLPSPVCGANKVGFIETLSHLTTVGNMTRMQFTDRFEFMRKSAFHYFVVVIEDLATGRIAASGTLVLERKFIHEGGLVGHIEDIVSNSAYRGKNLGRAVIEALKSIGAVVGCYKIILDCSDKNVPFYQKLGFAKKEVEMALYLEQPAKSKL